VLATALSPDGKSLAAILSRPEGASAAAQFRRGHPRVQSLMWTSDNGSKIIVLGAQPGRKKGSFTGRVFIPTPAGQTAGVTTGNQYTPPPWPDNVVDAAW
jgi:hypothetical protein